MMKFLRKIGAKFSHRSSTGLPTRGEAIRKQYANLDSLINDHFARHSDANHPCRQTMSLALEMLNQKPAVIVETGSSAWGTNSSLLFDSYVNSFGGSFSSVDIRPEPSMTLKGLCSARSQFFCDDSVSFLKKTVKNECKIDLVYLDSWDVDWSDPIPSSLHGLHEFLSIYPLLGPGSLLLIDDTPLDVQIMSRVQPSQVGSFVASKEKYGFAPGKGALVKLLLRQNGWGKEISHQYQLLWQF